MKVLFLDFDGVLNTEQSYFYWKQHKEPERRVKTDIHAERFCPIAISNLNYLCQQVADVRIVISSSWRNYFPLDVIKELLQEDGFAYTERIIDKTDRCMIKLGRSSRADEIKEWLENYEKTGSDDLVTDWIAVDDHSHNIEDDRLYLVNQEDGLYIEAVYSIIQRFQPDWKRPIFLM